MYSSAERKPVGKVLTEMKRQLVFIDKAVA
jgi:hypothetical protein